jgi:hypothetical protein
MSSDRSRPTPETGVDSAWDAGLHRVREIIRKAPPRTAIDPLVMAERTGLPLGEVIALLQALSHRREGRLELRVVDRGGREIASYPSLRDVPSSVTDRFGDTVRIYPENVELVFRLAP